MSLFGATTRYASSRIRVISSQSIGTSRRTRSHPCPRRREAEEAVRLGFDELALHSGRRCAPEVGELVLVMSFLLQSVANVVFPRTNQVGDPWLRRSVTSGNDVQI